MKMLRRRQEILTPNWRSIILSFQRPSKIPKNIDRRIRRVTLAPLKHSVMSMRLRMRKSISNHILSTLRVVVLTTTVIIEGNLPTPTLTFKKRLSGVITTTMIIPTTLSSIAHQEGVRMMLTKLKVTCQTSTKKKPRTSIALLSRLKKKRKRNWKKKRRKRKRRKKKDDGKKDDKDAKDAKKAFSQKKHRKHHHHKGHHQ